MEALRARSLHAAAYRRVLTQLAAHLPDIPIHYNYWEPLRVPTPPPPLVKSSFPRGDLN